MAINNETMHRAIQELGSVQRKYWWIMQEMCRTIGENNTVWQWHKDASFDPTQLSRPTHCKVKDMESNKRVSLYDPAVLAKLGTGYILIRHQFKEARLVNIYKLHDDHNIGPFSGLTQDMRLVTLQKLCRERSEAIIALVIKLEEQLQALQEESKNKMDTR